ncbi:hypothetical protein Tco_0736758 [Tanacetum coccineum]
MTSSSSNYSNPYGIAPTECKGDLPPMKLTAWTKENPARIFKNGIKKCKFWDWYDDELENEWYRLLNPS